MSSSHQVPQWLDQATFYEIYPQSFADSNADGIGDIPGIIEHLDYLLQLGCNAIWLNPLYESPFRDAGYDISDYKKVAARYGTNDDLAALFAAAHARGMHVLLDLVPGHTSNEHPWFRQSATDSPNLYDDRYIWINAGSRRRRTAVHRRRGGARRRVHRELLRIPTGTQLRFRPPAQRLAGTGTRRRGAAHL